MLTSDLKCNGSKIVSLSIKVKSCLLIQCTTLLVHEEGPGHCSCGRAPDSSMVLQGLHTTSTILVPIA